MDRKVKRFNINKSNDIPIYLQLASWIESNIMKRKLLEGERLPSINKIKIKYKISKGTILLSYKELIKKGLVESIPCKGFYVKRNLLSKIKVLFLLDNFTVYKEKLLESFKNNLKNLVDIEIFFHNHSYEKFDKVINDNIGNFQYYIIMPSNFQDFSTNIQKLPVANTIILDTMHPKLKEYNGVYQDFFIQVYNGLKEILPKIKKYNSLKIIFPITEQVSILDGLKKICKDYQLHVEEINCIEEKNIKENELYFIPDDANLISFLQIIKNKKYTIGKEVGLISYNDSYFKECFNITTISTDFKEMGKTLSKFIKKKSRKKKIKINKFNINIRNSL